MSVAADALPDEPADWLFARLQDVVWADDPVRQIAANLLLFMAALVSSTVTLGATLILAVIFFTFFWVGVARLAYKLIRG